MLRRNLNMDLFETQGHVTQKSQQAELFRTPPRLYACAGYQKAWMTVR